MRSPMASKNQPGDMSYADWYAALPPEPERPLLTRQQRQKLVSELRTEVQQWCAERASFVGPGEEGAEEWDAILQIIYDDIAFHTKELTAA